MNMAPAPSHASGRRRELVRARVFTAEHIMAIALQTGRAKDKALYFSSSSLGSWMANAYGASAPGTHGSGSSSSFLGDNP